jgi:hypothetical protein
MEPFTKALGAVAEVMHDGAASHPDNDWIRRTAEYHIDRAEVKVRIRNRQFEATVRVLDERNDFALWR